MANYDNIKPYADFAHEAAKHGGVDCYLAEIADANRKLGILEEKDSEGWKGALLLGAGLLLWEGGKAGIRSIKAHRAKKKAQEVAELKQRSEAAKEAIIQGVQQATAEEMDIVEARVDTEYEEE